jgi:predicted PurR-regulated permease PerM
VGRVSERQSPEVESEQGGKETAYDHLTPSEKRETPKEVREARTWRGHILFFFAVILAGALAWRLRNVLELVYVSALFAVVLMPMVQEIQKVRIRRWSPSRPLAIVVLVLGVLAALVLFFMLCLPPVLRDIHHFVEELPARIPDLVGRIHRLPMSDKLGLDSLAAKSQGIAASAAGYVFSSVPLWLAHIFDVVTAFILCLYFMLEGEYAYDYFLSFFEPDARARLDKTLLTAEHRMSKWLLGQGSLMLILGTTSTIVFSLLHVRYAILLGVLMGLFNIVPVAGGIITILLAASVAALDSWTKMAAVFAFYAIYVQLENGYLTPRIMKTSVNLMGLAVLIALLAGTALAGIVGALVAVPTAALLAVLMDEYMVQKAKN